MIPDRQTLCSIHIHITNITLLWPTVKSLLGHPQIPEVRFRIRNTKKVVVFALLLASGEYVAHPHASLGCLPLFTLLSEVQGRKQGNF